MVLGCVGLLERNDEFDENAPSTVAWAVVAAIVAVSYRNAI